MKKTIALSALALSLAAGGTAVAHTYAASTDSTSTAEVSTAKPDYAGKGGKGFGHRGGMKIDQAAVASLLGLTEDELKTEQQAGKSLAAIAGEKGVEVQKVVDLVASTLKASLDEKLSAGTITQAQYDERAAEIATRAEEFVNRTFDAARSGEAKGGKGGMKIDQAAVASLLGLTEDELKTERQAGKSLAAIAGEKGVEVQKVVDLIASTLKASLDEKLSAGTITQAQYDERAAEIATRAEEFVNRTFDAARSGEGKGGKRGDGRRGAAAADSSTDATSESAESESDAASSTIEG
ncbi:hypothetical protein [Saccharibacillus kuerlensis]|uniref:Uncharacterized protein n=1 Tax=Saccharibacillus kuerlensis TaxID=459527 RepID=A0ABQ2L0Q7_9BACL|nr:hypothetical protein [Saccharibacillus kuerlensis]GGN98283.1 hypothetical protein GCM10010969_17200 [Saccharibacillus kuerlensis]